MAVPAFGGVGFGGGIPTLLRPSFGRTLTSSGASSTRTVCCCSHDPKKKQCVDVTCPDDQATTLTCNGCSPTGGCSGE